MQEIAHNQCEWAVNNAGEVLLALPSFHKSSLDVGTLEGNHLIVRYDWFLRVRIAIPDPVIPYVRRNSSILVVAYDRDGNITENDLQVKNPAAP